MTLDFYIFTQKKPTPVKYEKSHKNAVKSIIIMFHSTFKLKSSPNLLKLLQKLTMNVFFEKENK